MKTTKKTPTPYLHATSITDAMLKARQEYIAAHPDLTIEEMMQIDYITLSYVAKKLA